MISKMNLFLLVFMASIRRERALSAPPWERIERSAMGTCGAHPDECYLNTIKVTVVRYTVPQKKKHFINKRHSVPRYGRGCGALNARINGALNVRYLYGALNARSLRGAPHILMNKYYISLPFMAGF